MGQPWGISGPQFLGLYLAGMAATLAVARVLPPALLWIPRRRTTRELTPAEGSANPRPVGFLVLETIVTFVLVGPGVIALLITNARVTRLGSRYVTWLRRVHETGQAGRAEPLDVAIANAQVSAPGAVPGAGGGGAAAGPVGGGAPCGVAVGGGAALAGGGAHGAPAR